MADLLTIQDLNVIFISGGTRVPALRGVTLSVAAGKTVALVGESGSGKTTIGQAVMGLLDPRRTEVSGQILFRDPAKPGTSINILQAGESGMRVLRGSRIAMAFQEASAAFSPVIGIGPMLNEMIRAHDGLTERQARTRAIDLLRRVGFPEPDAAYGRYVFELSGGLRQRAMLASALACKPALVIADEPTSALDVTVQALALKLLSDLRDEMGLSLMFITHDLGVVANIADSVVVLRDGVIVEEGPVTSLLARPQSAYAKELLACVPRLDGPPYPLNPSHVEMGVTNRLAGAWGKRHPLPAGTPLVSVRDASKTFLARKTTRGSNSHKVEALIGVSLELGAGECVGLVGESGCGKSTLSRAIMRAVQLDSGSIMVSDGQQMRSIRELSGPSLSEYRARVQYIFQDPFASLNPRMRAFEIITEPFVIHGIGTRRDHLAWAAALFEMVGLDPATVNRYPNAFSGGQRQRIGIARALALRPELLVCDEPLSALDASVQSQILTLLEGIRQDLGVAFLFVSHNLAAVRAIAGRVVVMCAGRIVEAAPTAALFRNPIHPYTQALLAAHPEPDPGKRLDLGALMQGRASDPAAWPPPFRLTGGAKPRYETVGEGHFVATA